MYHRRTYVQANSWITAVAAWERSNPRMSKERRDNPSWPRNVARERSNQTVRRGPNGSVIFCLHHTDCVTWHEDNSVTLEAYPSKLTNKFVNALLPDSIYAYYTWPVAPVIQLGHWADPNSRYYLVPDGLRLRPGPTRFDDGTLAGEWHVDTSERFEQFKVVMLDRAKARAALKATNYHDYVAWRNAAEALNIGVQSERDNFDQLEALADRTQWPRLRGLSYWKRGDERLREWIYARAGCYYFEYKDSLTRSELLRAQRNDRLHIYVHH